MKYNGHNPIEHAHTHLKAPNSIHVFLLIYNLSVFANNNNINLCHTHAVNCQQNEKRRIKNT